MKQLELFPRKRPKRPKREQETYRTAKYTSVCKLCGRYIRPRERMVWYGPNRFERPWVHPKCKKQQA